MRDGLLTYISLFSGAGIGCYGFKQEGFECVATCEIVKRRLDVQRANKKCRYDSGYIDSDIRDVETKKKIFQQIELYKAEGIEEVDVVLATPPCQGMSVANHKKKGNEIERNSLVLESIDLVFSIRPKIFIFENVRAFLKSDCINGEGGIEKIGDLIQKKLAGIYNIDTRVVNFKEYGVPSSRTRTLVIGTRRDILDLTPFDLIPSKGKVKTLRQSIGKMRPLSSMGEIDSKDIYHSFREYDKKMFSWVKNTKEGETAFDNKKKSERPHKIVDGKILEHTNKNGDKYKRNVWSEIGPCVHTRNDILASQATIHPCDNRVFSVRELMILMSIPSTFKWSDFTTVKLNNFSEQSKREYIKRNDVNVRQCIGEAVPTLVFRKIAKNILRKLRRNSLSSRDYNKIISLYELKDIEKLKKFISKNIQNFEYSELVNIIELANLDRLNRAGYYTKKSICFDLVSDLPKFKNDREIRILEPSVGGGAFIPLLIEKYKNNRKVVIDVFDIDLNIITSLKLILRKLTIPRNVVVNVYNEDFLFKDFTYKYDVIVGNPPFGNIVKNSETLLKYRAQSENSQNNNIFSFFLDKSMKLSDTVAFVCPKGLLSNPNFNKMRSVLEKRGIVKISDYGEEAFDVKIETIGLVVDKKDQDVIKVVSLKEGSCRFKPKEYVCSNQFPNWLLYRNKFFDSIASNLCLGVFSVFRDRQITKRHISGQGNVRVIKSRNVGDCEIRDIDGYDKFLDTKTFQKFKVCDFMNKENMVLVPNLTYNPRACFLPRNAVADGSVGILIPKEEYKVKESDLQYFGVDEFKNFYAIARNRGTRSLNIDANSVYYFGIKR